MSFTVYPAIDLRAGKVVRLKEGDPARMKSYSDDPAQTARHWLSMGARWLHVVNLDGAFGENDSLNHFGLSAILDAAKEFGARIQFGGGMRSVDDIQHAIDLGISRVVLGTIAIKQPDVVVRGFAKIWSGTNCGWDRCPGWACVMCADGRITAESLRWILRCKCGHWACVPLSLRISAGTVWAAA